ncbi:MAG: hypothetical protein KDC54_17595 [Lewinella sp.]|nr:hypothetical protein [Lewinella sp.]
MIKLSHTFFALALVTAALFLGCKKEDNNPNGCGTANYNYTLEIQAEAQAFSDAAAAYAQDQSTANCLAYQSAAQAYLDAAADLDNCVPSAQRPSYLQAIADAQVELDALSC